MIISGMDYTWYIHTVDYYRATRINELDTQHRESTMLSKGHQTQSSTCDVIPFISCSKVMQC